MIAVKGMRLKIDGQGKDFEKGSEDEDGKKG